MEVDLIIAGAGPAGLSTAMHLLEREPSWADRMLILEKSAHPRHKLCGGGVTRFGLIVLRDLGFPLPLPLPQACVDDIRLAYCGRVVHVRGKPMAAIFHRDEFDYYLARGARARGVRILENNAVRSIEFTADGVSVTSEKGNYRAQVLVGADGSNGSVRRYTRQMEKRSHTARLLEVVEPGIEQDIKFSQRTAWFDFSPVRGNLQGYFWDFPSRINGEPVYNRGVYDVRMISRRPRADLTRLIGDSLSRLGSDPSSNKIEGHPIHWFTPGNIFSLPRLILVGDAAGADPLFGEGIAPALAGGRVAADAIQAAFVRQDFSFRDYRRNMLLSDLGKYLLLRWWTAYWSYLLCRKAWFMHLFWSFGDLLTRVWRVQEALY